MSPDFSQLGQQPGHLIIWKYSVQFCRRIDKHSSLGHVEYILDLWLYTYIAPQIFTPSSIPKLKENEALVLKERSNVILLLWNIFLDNWTSAQWVCLQEALGWNKPHVQLVWRNRRVRNTMWKSYLHQRGTHKNSQICWSIWKSILYVQPFYNGMTTLIYHFKFPLWIIVNKCMCYLDCKTE